MPIEFSKEEEEIRVNKYIKLIEEEEKRSQSEVSTSNKRSSLPSPTILKYPREGG